MSSICQSPSGTDHIRQDPLAWSQTLWFLPVLFSPQSKTSCWIAINYKRGKTGRWNETERGHNSRFLFQTIVCKQILHHESHKLRFHELRAIMKTPHLENNDPIEPLQIFNNHRHKNLWIWLSHSRGPLTPIFSLRKTRNIKEVMTVFEPFHSWVL